MDLHAVFILFVLIGLACLLAWGARVLLAAFAVPDPFRTVIWVFVVIALCFAVVDQSGLLGGGHFFRL